MLGGIRQHASTLCIGKFFVQFLLYKRFCKNQNNTERDDSLPLMISHAQSAESRRKQRKSSLGFGECFATLVIGDVKKGEFEEANNISTVNHG